MFFSKTIFYYSLHKVPCNPIWSLESYTSLVKSIPKYFIGFDAIITGIVFLTAFANCPLLVYKNTTDSYVLILCSTTVLNSFISANSFLVVS